MGNDNKHMANQEHVERNRKCRCCGEPVTPTSYWFCRLHVERTKEWDEHNEENEFFDLIRTAKKAAHK